MKTSLRNIWFQNITDVLEPYMPLAGAASDSEILTSFAGLVPCTHSSAPIRRLMSGIWGCTALQLPHCILRERHRTTPYSLAGPSVH